MTRRRKIEPPSYTPKFQAGDPVRVSALGVKNLEMAPGTEGVVEACGIVVYVSIDGKRAVAYHVDFWDAVPSASSFLKSWPADLK